MLYAVNTIMLDIFLSLILVYHISFILWQLDFKMEGGRLVPLVYSCLEEWDSSLKLLIDWSPFSSKEELLQQVCFEY